MSFFDRLKEGIELFTDFRTEMKDLLDEGREIFTDGFKEMVLKDNTNYKTSFEIKSDASTIISQAQEKYEKAYNRFTKKAHALEQDIDSHYAYIADIVNISIARWSEQAKHWGTLHLEEFATQKLLAINTLSLKPKTSAKRLQKLFSPADIKGFRPEYKQQKPINDFLQIVVRTPQPFNKYLAQLKRVKAANDFLEAANDFESNINVELAKIKDSENKIKCVSLRLQETESLLNLFDKELVRLLNDIENTKRPAKPSRRYLDKTQISGLLIASITALIEDSFVDEKGNAIVKDESLYRDILQIKSFIAKNS